MLMGTNDPTPGKAGWFETLVATGKDIAPILVQTRAQQLLFKAQLQRAKAGLPPLKTEEYAPTMRIQAGASPELMQQFRDGVKSFAVPVVIGIAALGLFFLMQRRRRTKG